MSVKPIPEGFTTITPYLIVSNAKAAIDFYKQAFDAKEIRRMEGGGKILHCDIKIGNAHFMLADEFPDQGFKSPTTIGGSPAFIHLYVEDADKSFERAIQAGAKSLQEPKDQIFGDRHGLIQDPFGHTWTIATHIEDVPTEELKLRIAKYF